MTIPQAKADLTKRLDALGIGFTKITGKSQAFSGFGYDEPRIFLKVHGIDYAALRANPEQLAQWRTLNETRGKGYIISSV